jgi:hypothetical protein
VPLLANLVTPLRSSGAGKARGAPARPSAAFKRAGPPPALCSQVSSASNLRATAEVQQQLKELNLTPAQREGKEPVFEGRVTGVCGGLCECGCVAAAGAASCSAVSRGSTQQTQTCPAAHLRPFAKTSWQHL